MRKEIVEQLEALLIRAIVESKIDFTNLEINVALINILKKNVESV